MSRIIITTALFVVLFVGRIANANLIYNFDTPGSEATNGGHGDGANTEGWTDTLGASKPSITVFGGRTSVTPGDQDTQNANMVFTSPAFSLTGNTIQVDLAGGQGYGNSPANPANFPANISNIPAGLSDQTASSLLILGLRNVATGNYVSFFQSPNNQDSWQTYSWDVSAVNHGPNYVIDQIDTRFGGWGHIELDNVNIQGVALPEPSSWLLFGLASLALVALGRRRRA